MHWRELIFSEKPGKRLQRHLLFWMAWWLYLSLCDYFFQLPLSPISTTTPFHLVTGSFTLLKTFLLVLIYAAACYVFIYLILPQLIKGKWWKASAKIFLLGVFMFGAAYFLYWNVFPFVNSIFEHANPERKTQWFWPAVSFGLITPFKIVVAASIIKYAKYWWLKQKESEQLEREKINAELQLLKAQIRPGFLFTALNNIYDYSLAASPRAPELLLKLSDLLSYMLYECEQEFVPLEKEIEMMKDYMVLEKLRSNETIETELNVMGNMNGKMIAPFLLLPFFENSFKQSNSNTEQAWINMDISVDGNSFTMKLANGVLQQEDNMASLTTNSLANVQKRLDLLYPQKHELKINHEEEMLIVFLKIQLSDINTSATGRDEESVATEPFVTQQTFYAPQ